MDKASPKLAEAMATWSDTAAQVQNGVYTATTAPGHKYIDVITKDWSNTLEVFSIDSSTSAVTFTLKISGISEDGTPVSASVTMIGNNNSPQRRSISIIFSTQTPEGIGSATLSITSDGSVSLVFVTNANELDLEIFQHMVHCRQIH